LPTTSGRRNFDEAPPRHECRLASCRFSWPRRYASSWPCSHLTARSRGIRSQRSGEPSTSRRSGSWTGGGTDYDGCHGRFEGFDPAATLDGWPQFNYDGQATNRNHDEEVGIPTGIQWTTGPHRATASHGYRFAHGLAIYEWPDHTRGERDAGDSVVRLAQAGRPLVEYDARTGAIKRSIEASLVGGPQGRHAPDMGEAVLHGDTLLQVVEDRVAAIDWPAAAIVGLHGLDAKTGDVK
jgi:hypothetical protein